MCCVAERLVSQTEAAVKGYVKFWQRRGARPSARRTDPGDTRNLWADAQRTLILVDITIVSCLQRAGTDVVNQRGVSRSRDRIFFFPFKFSRLSFDTT